MAQTQKRQRGEREQAIRLLEGLEAFCASIRASLIDPSFEVKQKVLRLVVDGLGQFPRRRGGGWVRQIALTSFLPGAVVIDFPDDLCAAA